MESKNKNKIRPKKKKNPGGRMTTAASDLKFQLKLFLEWVVLIQIERQYVEHNTY